MTDEGFKRKLAAILSADVKGYSRLMGDDEESTVRTLKAYRAAVNDLVQQYRGRIVDSIGDNILAAFNSVVDAVNCAVEIQRDLAERNATLPENRKMAFRIGSTSGTSLRRRGAYMATVSTSPPGWSPWPSPAAFVSPEGRMTRWKTSWD